MRKQKRQRVSEMLGAVLGRDRLVRGLVPEVAWPIPRRDWDAAVGSKIALKARPVRLERGVLHVVTATAAWSNELSVLAQPILERLRRAGVDVRELRFRVGQVEERVMAPSRPAVIVPRPVELDATLAQEIARVEDDALRAAIETAARRVLAIANGAPPPARTLPKKTHR